MNRIALFSMRLSIGLIMGFIWAQGLYAASVVEINREMLLPQQANLENANQEALRTAKEIESGKNQFSKDEAAIQCPQDRYPQFTIKALKIVPLIVPNATGSTTKYSTSIEYAIACQI